MVLIGIALRPTARSSHTGHMVGKNTKIVKFYNSINRFLVRAQSSASIQYTIRILSSSILSDVKIGPNALRQD